MARLLLINRPMGYDIHITRSENWGDENGKKISLEEWLRYVESDPEVQRDPLNSPTDFLYVAHPEEPSPLWWHAGYGEIYTKDPDDATVRKMFAIASKLGAKVQGDEGELYDENARPGKPR